MRKADDIGMRDVLLHHRMIRGVNSREYYYPFLAGLPLAHLDHNVSTAVHYAYAAWRLKNHNDALSYLNTAIAYCQDEDKRDYLDCIRQYIRYIKDGIPQSQVMAVLSRFFLSHHIQRLEDSLSQYGDCFSDLLMACQLPHCSSCPHKDICYYEESKRVIRNAGLRYREFVHGQDRDQFKV